MKKEIGNVQNKNKILFSFIFLIIGIVILSFSYHYFKLNPFEKVELTNISKIAVDESENIYTVSDSNRKISKISDFSNLSYVIDGGSRKKESFYLATELEPDKNGNLYVLHNRWDDSGSYLEMETITKFDSKGEFLEIVFELPDETESKLTPAMMGLKYYNNSIYWFVMDEKFIYGYSNKSDKPVLKIPFKNANIIIQDVDRLDDKNIVLASKTGKIETLNIDTYKKKVIYDSKLDEKNKLSNVWNIASNKIGEIYFNDIGKYEIYKSVNDKIVPVFKGEKNIDSYDQVYYDFDFSKTNIFAVNDEKITLKTEGNEYIDIGSLTPSSKIFILRIAFWISAIIILISLFIIIRWLFVYVLKGKISGNAKKNITIIIIIIILGIAISNLAIKFYNDILVTQVNDGLKMIVQNSQHIIDGDAVDRIESPSDFYNEDYQIVFDDIQKIINYNSESWNENLYTALYTIKDERYYALIYNDNSVTPFYPFNAWTNDDYYYYFYDAYQGQITQGTEVDADGEWLFSMGPVYNKNGDIVAIIEVGMNKYIFDEWNRKIVSQIIIDIISIIIIAILLLSEITFFTNWIGKSKKIENEFNELNIIRTLALLTYVMIFMCTAFIPIMAKSIYSPIGNMSMSLAISLPILVEVFFAAITIIFAGYIAEKKGWKIIFYMGMIFLIGAAIATAMTRSLIIFIIIRGFAGIGNGMIQMTMHGFINTGKSLKSRNEAFANMMSGAIAGINLGVVFGANLADKIGYFKVFYIIAGLGFLALLFQIIFMRHYDNNEYKLIDEDEHETQDKEKKENKKLGILFFTKKDVVIFFSLVLIPAFLCYMYLEYYFPLFAQSRGLSTSVIGIIFSLYGLFIVYFGPSMSTFTEKYFGIKIATVAASVLTGVSLIIFALTGNLIGAIFAILVLAISDSFGETVYTTYFLALKESRKIGKSIAAGYLEFTSQIGKMIGALAFAIAIGIGEQLGIGIIGIMTLIFGLLFIPLGNKNPEKPQENDLEKDH